VAKVLCGPHWDTRHPSRVISDMGHNELHSATLCGRAQRRAVCAIAAEVADLRRHTASTFMRKSRKIALNAFCRFTASLSDHRRQRRMQMKKDDRVRHNAAPEWGLGRVLENPTAGKVRIFFSNVGVKTISLPANIVLVKGAEATSLLLDNLKAVPPKQESFYKPLALLKQRFL
jgi:hypothetical protein